MKIAVFSVHGGSEGCAGGSCPTVYETDRGTFIVQGAQLDRAASGLVPLPLGEQAVEVPADLLIAIADKLKAKRPAF